MNTWGYKKQIDALRKTKRRLKEDNPKKHEAEIKKINAAISRRKHKIADLQKLKPKKK